MSIAPFDEYLTLLLNRSTPMQAVWTVFGQEIFGPPGQRYGVVTYRAGDPLTQEEFTKAMSTLQQFQHLIYPALAREPRSRHTTPALTQGPPPVAEAPPLVDEPPF